VIEARRVIHAPQAALFAFLEDLDNHWQLTGGVVEPLGPSDGGARVLIHGPLGLRREATTRIDTATASELTGTARVGGGTEAIVAWRLRADGDGTEVALSIDVLRASGRDRLALALVGGSWLRGRLARALERLEDRALDGGLDVDAAPGRVAP
jgi:hypothetical protein